MRASEPRSRRPLVMWGLGLGALGLTACGGSSTPADSEPTPSATPSATPTVVPSAVVDPAPPAEAYACAITDTFSSGFTEADTGIDVTLAVTLSEPDCPAGDVVVSVDVTRNLTTGTPTQVAVATPDGEVQTELSLCAAPDMLCSSGRSLTVFFTAEEIVKVTLIGNGDPVDLTGD